MTFFVALQIDQNHYDYGKEGKKEKVVYEKPPSVTGHRDIVSGVLVYSAYARNSMANTSSDHISTGSNWGVSNGLSRLLAPLLSLL